MFADLHLHTHFSDGTYSPEELAEHARRQGLAAIALTDHDTVEGCARAAAACAERGIEFLTGTELTAELEDCELHLLGYGVDPEHPGLLRELARFQRGRSNRIHEMVARLNQQRVPLLAEAVFRLANCRSPGRPHVARALVQEGFCQTVDEAFERFLKKHRPAWVPKVRMSAVEGTALIRAAGGVAVMAHPALNHADRLIPLLVDAGLDGLECWHTKHSAAASQHYLALARQYRLLPTGGSDCHGLSKGQPLIGTVKLPYEHLARLKERLAERRAALVPPVTTATT
jgi:hypothetical protein